MLLAVQALGLVEWQAGRLPDARRAFWQGTKRFPGYSSLWGAWAKVEVGFCKTWKQPGAQVRRCMRSAPGLQPSAQLGTAFTYCAMPAMSTAFWPVSCPIAYLLSRPQAALAG